MCVPCSPSPNRIASAQPPANAAPNTSAPIRMAALMTVMTLGQTSRREDEEVAFMSSGVLGLEGRNLPEKAAGSKGKWPKKAPSPAIAGRNNRAQIGTCNVRTPPNYGLRDQPAAEGVGDAVCGPALRR